MSEGKSTVFQPQNRDTLVMILARNGYAVRQAKEKRGTSKSYTYFVEYWKEGGKPL